MGNNFPTNPPMVHSLSPIYHPNIDVHSKQVCLNLFSSATWLPSFGLQDAIQVSTFYRVVYRKNMHTNELCVVLWLCHQTLCNSCDWFTTIGVSSPALRQSLDCPSDMMTSSNGNIFRVTGPLWAESTGGFSSQRPVTRSFDVFFDLRLNKWVNNRDAGDLRRRRAHYDVIVMEVEITLEDVGKIGMCQITTVRTYQTFQYAFYRYALSHTVKSSQICKGFCFVYFGHIIGSLGF